MHEKIPFQNLLQTLDQKLHLKYLSTFVNKQKHKIDLILIAVSHSTHVFLKISLEQ